MENPQGLSVTSSPDPEGVRRALEGERYFGTVTLNDEHLRVLSAPLRSSRGVVGVLQIGQSIESQRSALSRLAIILAASEGGALLLALAGGWFLADRALVPIRRSFDRQRRFVADASHELRTPLTLIRSSAELLARHKGQGIDENQHLIEGVLTESEYLSGLVSGLLTLAQSDAGKLALRVEPLDIEALVQSVGNAAMPLAQSKDVELVIAQPGESSLVEGDPERLRQLLLLLLDNALKYTPAGGRVEVRADVGETGVVVTVSDTGEGIHPEHLPHIFDRFYRADPARGREAGGAGLGLSIAKTLAEAHDGTIDVDSMVGRGTTVRVHMPLAGTARQAVPDPLQRSSRDEDLGVPRGEGDVSQVASQPTERVE